MSKIDSNYLSKRKQGVKIGSSLSDWLEVILGVLQGSLLGSILFRQTFVSSRRHHFIEMWKYLDIVLENLEMDTNIAINWLINKEMVANPKKIQLMFLARNKSIKKEMSFVGKAIKSCSTAELLGITLDKNLNFEIHIENIFCKGNNKIKAYFRIRSFLTLEQAKALAEAYILSNFRYCQFVWKFCGKCSNSLIMKTHY